MTSFGVAAAQPALVRSGTDNIAWWAALAALCGVLVAPLFVVDVPPLLDYPNHLARAFVLASLPDDTVLARFYAPHWSVIPNLALDLVAPALIQVLPVHVAGRLLIAAAVLLPVLGTVACSIALSPRTGARWWSLGAGLVAYNSCLLLGFLNFAIAVGLALLLAAAWLRWREPHPLRAIAVALPGAVLLFACHLMGLVLFGLLIGGAELSRLHQMWLAGAMQTSPTFPERAPRARALAVLVRAALVRGAALLLIFAAPSGLYAVSTLQPLGGDAQFLPAGEKLLQLVTAFETYAWQLDTAVAVLAIGAAALGLVLRRASLPGPAACAIVLLLIAFLAAPFAWKGTYFLDTRFAVMLGFILFAGLVPANWPAWLRFATAAALGLLFVARMVLLTNVWADRADDLADLRRALAPVQPGQAVYVAAASREEAPVYWDADPHWRRLANGLRTDLHLGALVVIEHRAFWPLQFDNPSQQPIETREPYRSLARAVGHVASRTETEAAGLCGFDYVLLLEADAVPDLPSDRFRLLSRSGFAALYAITQCKPDP